MNQSFLKEMLTTDDAVPDASERHDLQVWRSQSPVVPLSHGEVEAIDSFALRSWLSLGSFGTVQESGVTARKPWVPAMVRRPRVARDSVTSHRVKF